MHIENVTIQGFAQQGIDFAPSSTVDLFVRDTIISNNQGGGIAVAPSGAAGARVSLSNVRLDQNGAFGLSVTKASGVFAAITVEDTNVEKNGIGLRASGASAFIILSGSTVAHNATGLQTLTGGKISSSGNNVIYLNNVDGAPTQHDCFEVVQPQTATAPSSGFKGHPSRKFPSLTASPSIASRFGRRMLGGR